jgi:hypothetical protein
MHRKMLAVQKRVLADGAVHTIDLGAFVHIVRN